MKLLLDTHILLWWLSDNPRLKPKIRSAIASPQSCAMGSFASIWEIAIKHRIGKLNVSSAEVMALLESEGFALLPFAPQQCAMIEALPQHHADPFDHMIIAQAQAHDAAIITSDAQFAHYDVRCLPN